MKTVSLLLILLLFIGNSFKNFSQASQIPLTIVYKNKNTPDSISDFMKVYFQTKKIEVIRWDQAMALFKEAMFSEMMKQTNSGKFNEESAKKFVSNMDPVCNILSMTIYNDLTHTEDYLVDSIHWYVDLIPVRDTSNRITNTFIPLSENKNNPYLVLKSFADKVLQSKLLK